MNKLIRFLLPEALITTIRQLYYRSRYSSVNLMVGKGCIVKNVEFGNHVFLGADVRLTNSSIGDHSYVNTGCRIQNTRIGKFTSIGPNVSIVLGNHPIDMVSTHPAFYANNKSIETFSDKMYFDEYGEVEIGNDVWLGQDVMIPGNVKIGDGAVILPKAVVSKDVEPYAVVGGVPAKLIKYRFDPQTIETLLQDKWWDKDTVWLKKNFRSFHRAEDYLKLVRTESNASSINSL